jgi:diguanylate cyclase (GGDEF)-like protein
MPRAGADTPWVMVKGEHPRGAQPRIPLPPWLARRLGMATGAERTPEDPAEDHALIARALALLFFCGASLSVVWLLLDHDPAAREPAIWAMTIGAYAVGLLLITGYDHLPPVVLKGSITAATVVITGALYANFENGSVYAFYYVWATVYAFSFFSMRQAMGQTALVGVAFGGVLILQRDIWQEEVARWLLLMGTTIAAGMLVRYLTGSLRHRSLHDPLTGLANRQLYLDALDDALEQAREDEQGGHVAVLFLDLDGFKYVNDSLGHQVGDGLLEAVAERLQASARTDDLTARFGGDEFALLCPGVASEDDALAIGRRLNEALAAGFMVGEHELRVSASIGVAISGSAEADSGVLLRDADAAMYAAKARGRARCELFGASLRRRMVERLSIENDLRPALERDQLEVHYQPIVSLESARIVGVEALIRWQHPERGLVSPAEFIPVAEETGLIVPIGRMVLERACVQIAAWDASGGPLAGISLSVNLSARQLPHPELLANIQTALRRARIAPSRLTLELTESTLMDEDAGPAETLAALRRSGIRLALDDFGTGYSSLAYLQRFALDEIKLDRSFVAGVGHGGSEDAIIGAVLALARALRIPVVAEGIEQEDQARTLRGLGCALGQGYLYSRPRCAVDLEAALGGEPALLLAS